MPFRPLKHNDTNTSHLRGIGQVLLIDSSLDRGRAVVIDVVVKLAITSTEFKLLEEERVVVKGECVEDIEFGLALSLALYLANSCMRKYSPSLPGSGHHS